MALLCSKLSSFDPNISYRSRTLDELNSLCNVLNGSKSKLSNSLQFVLKSRINPKSENEINANANLFKQGTYTKMAMSKASKS
jgi:hypothetical protein